MSLRRIDPTPLSWLEFVRPLSMVRRASIVIPACAYAMCFLWGGILPTVEVPQLLQEKFGLNAEQLGLQFLGAIIGSLIGEQMGGALSDYWMTRRQHRLNRKPDPEFRLWLSYFGFALVIIGIVVFLVCTQESPSGHWNVSPIIGIGIGAAGNQLVTTVMITYAVDCFPQEAASVGVFITFVRQVWGFIGPFWYVLFFHQHCPMYSNTETNGFPFAGSRPCLRMSVSRPVLELAARWSSRLALSQLSSCIGVEQFGVGAQAQRSKRRPVFNHFFDIREKFSVICSLSAKLCTGLCLLFRFLYRSVGRADRICI